MKVKINNDLKVINYPVCFDEIKIGTENRYKHFIFRVNYYYSDYKFFPTKFYKPIIKV